MRRTLAYVIAVWLSLVWLAAAEHHGRVNFAGLPLPGATVVASQADKKFSTVTDQQGAYSFPALPDGTWTIRIEMLCFAPLQKDVAVDAAAAGAAWDLILLPLAEIKASAPPAPPAVTNTAPAIVSTAAAPTPRAKGAAFQKTDLQASANAAKPDPEPASPAAPADANQTASDVFAINGSVNNGAVSPFAQSAAFGNFRKGQGNAYRGALGLVLDNSNLDARAFSLTGQDTPKPDYNHFSATASLGGPLRIPHLLSGNNTNFFVGYQWMRNRNATTQSSLMPTAAQRTGDLSQLAGNIIDPASGAPFPGNAIPQSRISSQTRALLNFYPLPNFAGAARYNYQIPITGNVHQDSLQGRINETFNRKNQMFGLFGYQSTRSDSPNIFGFVDTAASTGFNANVSLRHSFTPRVYANFGFQFSRLSSRATPWFANRQNVSADAGIAGNLQDPLNWGPPNLSFASGIAGLTDGNESFNRNQTAALSYDTLWNHRSHNVTFGGDFKRQQFNALSQQDARGTFTFTGALSGNAFSEFLLGIPDTSSIAFGNADKYFRASLYDAYITDDWRVRPGLTANIGMRWEYNAPIVETQGRLVNLDIAPNFTAEAPVVAAHPTGTLTHQTYPDSLVHPDKRAFEPRVAVSWRPFGASSMVVRAGYGLYYNTSVYQSIASQMAQQSPLSKSLSVSNTAANPLTLANGFNASNVTTPNTFAIDPDFRVGYAHNWQVSVQRDLPTGLVATATYLGIKGTRAMQEFLPNTFPAGAVNPCPACPAGYVYLTSNGNSTRESGQFQLRRRLHAGLTASVQYTLSKSIDDAALGGKGQGTAVIAQNWLDLSGERGLSLFDQRHLLNAQLQYSTGVGVRGGALLSGWRGKVSRDWTFISQVIAGSGLPQTPIYLTAVQGTGVTGSIRPNFTGMPLYSAPAGLSLNPAAYAPPASGQWGNAGRDSITGPSELAVSASMSRTFRLTDRYNADFRFDSTNPINHVTYTSWVTNISSSQFGLPTGANPMRSMQATIRVRF
jgi:hypothetical protein